MAKIYETEKDKHRELASLDYEVGAAFARGGLMTATFSFIAAAVGYIAKPFISKDAKDLFGGSRLKNLERTNLWMLGMGTAGLASGIAGLLIKKRATALTDRIGREQIIEPAEAQNYLQTRTDHAAQLIAEQAASQAAEKSL